MKTPSTHRCAPSAALYLRKAMAAPAKHRPIRRAFLERVARPVLARVLAPFAAPLLARGVDVTAVASAPAIERRDIERLVEILAVRDEALADLHAVLLLLDDVASPAAQEALFAADVDRVLDHELGFETVVVVAYLDHRPLFDRVRPASVSTASKASACFAPKTVLPFPDDRELDAKLERVMRAELKRRLRSNYFKEYWTRQGTERHVEIVYGKVAATRDLIAKKDGEEDHELAAQVTDRSTERAFAVVHEDTGLLTVSGQEWMKELVRRALGEVYFESAAHYGGNEMLTLAPVMMDLDAALSAEGVPDLERVELVELWAGFEDGSGGAAYGGAHVMNRIARAVAQVLLEMGKTIEEAHFALYVKGRAKPVGLKVKVPRKLEYPRSDRRIAGVVRDWLVARGIMVLPEAVREELDSTGTAEGARGEEREGGGAGAGSGADAERPEETV